MEMQLFPPVHCLVVVLDDLTDDHHIERMLELNQVRR